MLGVLDGVQIAPHAEAAEALCEPLALRERDHGIAATVQLAR